MWSVFTAVCGFAFGSYHVHVSLARTSMWLQELGPCPANSGPTAKRAHLPCRLRDIDMMQI